MIDDATTPTPPSMKSLLKRLLLIAGVIILVLFIGIQFVPVSRTNPPVSQEISAPTEVLSVLRESCYDCHSNETQWPWYSYVAPMSWLVAGHVEHGREEMNFSEWDQYDVSEQEYLIIGINDETQKGRMPLENYLKLHASARLTDQDKTILSAWSKTALGLAPAPQAPESHSEHAHDEDS